MNELDRMTEAMKGDDFRAAVNSGNIDRVMQHLDAGFNIHYDNDFAARWSAGHGRLALLEMLYERGANIHVCSEHGLRLACNYGHLDVVDYLIDKGADVNADQQGAMLWALGHGHDEIAKRLVGAGISMRWINDFMMECLKRENLDMAQYFIDRGADPRFADDWALVRMTDAKLFLSVSFLIEKGADPLSQKQRPLHSILMNERLDVLSLCVKHGLSSSHDLIMQESVHSPAIAAWLESKNLEAQLHSQDRKISKPILNHGRGL